MAKEINSKLLLKSVMVLNNTSCNNVLLEKIPCPNCTKNMKVYWKKDVKTTGYEKLTVHFLLGAGKWHGLLA
jgi:hypothetical protein